MVNQNEIRYVGVDGCTYGWFSVGFSENGCHETAAFGTLSELLAHHASARLILVDMPIGLIDGHQERRCDPAARALLNQTQTQTQRGSTIFRAPSRTALEYFANSEVSHTVAQAIQGALGQNARQYFGQDIEQAALKASEAALRQLTKAVNRQYAGVSLPEQTLAIMPKINEVDRIMFGRARDVAPVIREIHPEICFWALNDKQPIVSKKNTPEGIDDRIDVLNRVLDNQGANDAQERAREIFDAAKNDFPKRHVSHDDILDALAAAVTARGGSLNQLHKLPNEPQRDDRGLTMEMVYWLPNPGA